jgi:NAD(P)-dependent dehydrogenase (short-subunit alcohol dehydrogenase family)
MEYDFSNQNAVVLGGQGNLGFEISNLLIKNNISKIFIIDINTLQKKEFIENTNTEIFFYEFDIEKVFQIKDFFSKKFNCKIDIFINAAAFVGTSNLNGWNEIYENQTLDTWNRAVDVNLTAANEIIKALLPNLKESDSSSIVNISSIYGFTAPRWDIYKNTNINNPAAYNVSKAGLIQLTKYLAGYLAEFNIRVNSVSPGGIYSDQNSNFVDNYSKRTPMGRMANFKEVAQLNLFLSSSNSKYITGQNIVIDGGFSIS